LVLDVLRQARAAVDASPAILLARMSRATIAAPTAEPAVLIGYCDKGFAADIRLGAQESIATTSRRASDR